MTDKKYNPMSIEFQDECKKLGLTGYQYRLKLIKEGKVVNPSDIERKYQKTFFLKLGYTKSEYQDRNCQKLGYKDRSDYSKERKYENGMHLPMEFNEDCSSYFGIYIAENYIMKTFEDPIPMLSNNPGFDWLCKNGLKIQSKATCITYNNQSSWSGWSFGIKYNNIADVFLCSGWDNRDSLRPLFIWAFNKNDMVRKGKGYYAPKVEFWNRSAFTVTNKSKYLKQLIDFEVTSRLEKLKKICNKDDH